MSDVFVSKLRRFIKLRFWYLGALSFGGLFSQLISSGPRSSLLVDLATALAVLFLNWVLLVSTKADSPKRNQAIAIIAISLDIVAASFILFSHGGVESRSIILYSIPIAASSILFSRHASIITAAVCALIYDTLITLQYLQIISPLNIVFKEQIHERGYLIESIVFYTFVLGVLALVTNFANRLIEESRQALHRQQQLASEAQHLARLGSWEWNIPANKITWSDELYRIFGVKKTDQDPPYEQYLNLVHPEDKAKVDQMVRKALEEKQSFKVEHRVIWPDGQIRIIHGEGRVQTNENDEVIKMVGTAQDITEQAVIRRQLERRSTELEHTREAILNVLEDLEKEKVSLEEERVKDEALLASIGEGLIVIDAEGKITKINPYALEVLGYSETELSGQWFPKVLPMLDEDEKPVPPFERPVVQALSTGKAVSRTVHYIRKNGTHFPVFVTVSPFIIGELPAGAVVVFRDVTEELKLERAKEEFVSLASHQLRTPATGVKAFASMLADGYAGKLNAKQTEFLGKVMESNERQLQIIEDMLNVARADAGRLILVKEEFDVVSMIDDVLIEQKATIDSRKQTLTFDKPHGAIKVNADPKRYRMVVENILSNASKYTPEGGKITIQVKSEFGKVGVVIKDTGVGIAKKDMSTLFSRFGRIDNPLAAKVGGTGLGLYLAKEIMDLHSGKILVKSEPGKGTEFTVELPLKAGSPPKARPKVKLA